MGIISQGNFREMLTCPRAVIYRRGVKTLAVFGSFARGEATLNRDIDVLVEFDQPAGLFEFIPLNITWKS